MIPRGVTAPFMAEAMPVLLRLAGDGDSAVAAVAFR